MATKKHKKHKTKHVLRNAASPSHPSTGTRPRSGARTSGMGLGDDNPGWRAIKSVGGAAVAAVACALIAKQDLLPPKMITGAVSAVGAALAVGGHSDTLRAVGTGAMAAAGGQFGLMLIDDHYQTNQTNPTTSTVATAKKPANAQELPPGALEAAYERARSRLALAQTREAAA